MPTARVTRHVSRSDGSSFDVGDEVTGQTAQDAIAGDWGDLVREQRPETPEGARGRRQGRPERREQT